MRTFVAAAALLVAAGLAGCAHEQSPARSQPTRAEVTWADGMCRTVESIDARKAEPYDPSERDQDPLYGDSTAASYVSDASDWIGVIANDLAGLPKVPERAAMRLAHDYLHRTDRVQSRIDKLTMQTDNDGPMPAEQRRQAVKISALIGSIRAPHPGLHAVVAGNRALSPAYLRASLCHPAPGRPAPGASGSTSPTQLPSAADGTDLAACTEGNCEVRITNTARITVAGLPVRVTVSSSTVTFQVTDPDGTQSLQTTGAGGSSSWGSGDDNTTITAQVEAVRAHSALIAFSVERS